MTDANSGTATRRDLLAAAGVAAAAGLAGCSGGGSEGTATTADAPLGDHAAAADVRDQPRFGPPLDDAPGVVVAFEDPSCPRCAAFETGTVPLIRERLGDRVAFSSRSYPVVYPWGEPATQAIEAAFARETDRGSEAAGERTTAADAPYGSAQGSADTWKLIRYYFEHQSQFDADNVLDRTREFLAGQTDLDADGVVADAESEAYDDAVQADLDAGEEAGVGDTTPTVFLFRGGEFRTSANGSVSFDVVESALGL